MSINKRKENERKFTHWEDKKDGTRKYWFEIKGKMKWKARYVKVVDENETTISFRQEIYNDKNILVEIHEKYPIDKGHKKIK